MFFLIMILLTSSLSNAQQFSGDPVNSAGVLQKGIWSSLRNPAGMAETKKAALGVYHYAPFLLPELATSGLGLVIPSGKMGVFGLGLKRFGYKLYREQLIGFSFARNFGSMVMAGAGFRMIAVAMDEPYGKQSSFAASAGSVIQITEAVNAGFMVINPHRLKADEKSGEAGLSLGMGWKFRHSKLNAEVEKSVHAKEIVRCSFEYDLSSRFSLNGGITNSAEQFYFGFGLRNGSFEMGMTSGYHFLLGFSPRAHFIYQRK